MGRLWVITSYFNPAGFQRRLTNYRAFRERIAAPLATVELSFSGDFELASSDADMLIQLCGGDVMWQKERLLNIAIRHLPDDCHQVAWIDCDVVFETDHWVERATEALDRCSLVHLYDHRVNLARDAALGDSSLAEEIPSAIFKQTRGEATDDDFRSASAPLRSRSTVGLAWAARRSVLDHQGLYDACILGGADRAILGAALGRFDFGIEALRMADRQVDHYLTWARPFNASVQGHVGYIEGRCFHLWHGDLVDRRYEQRLDALARHSFDPSADIVRDAQDLWRWASDKPALHENVRSYFPSRYEDGR